MYHSTVELLCWWEPFSQWNLLQKPRVIVSASLEMQMRNRHLPGLPWSISVDSVPGVCPVVINLHCNKCFISLTKKKKWIFKMMFTRRTNQAQKLFFFVFFLQCLQSVSGFLRQMWQTQHLPVTWSKYKCFLLAENSVIWVLNPEEHTSYLSVHRINLLYDVTKASVLRLPVKSCCEHEVEKFLKERRLRACGQVWHFVLKKRMRKYRCHW